MCLWFNVIWKLDELIKSVAILNHWGCRCSTTKRTAEIKLSVVPRLQNTNNLLRIVLLSVPDRLCMQKHSASLIPQRASICSSCPLRPSRQTNNLLCPRKEGCQGLTALASLLFGFLVFTGFNIFTGNILWDFLRFRPLFKRWQ